MTDNFLHGQVKKGLNSPEFARSDCVFQYYFSELTFTGGGIEHFLLLGNI